MVIGVVDMLLALQLRALKDKMTLLVAFEAKFLLFVSLALLDSKSSNDDIEINSASVSSSASTIQGLDPPFFGWVRIHEYLVS
jgi:hypothetical protein